MVGVAGLVPLGGLMNGRVAKAPGLCPTCNNTSTDLPARSPEGYVSANSAGSYPGAPEVTFGALVVYVGSHDPKRLRSHDRCPRPAVVDGAPESSGGLRGTPLGAYLAGIVRHT